MLPGFVMNLAIIFFFAWLLGAAWDDSPPAKRTGTVVFLLLWCLLPAAALLVAPRLPWIRSFMFRPYASVEEVRRCGRPIALLLVVVGVLALPGCSRVPDCDSREAERLMQGTLFAMAASEFRAVGNPPISELPMPGPDVTVLSPRDQQLTDVFIPRLAMRNDVRWLKYRIAPQVVERHRIHPFPLYLKLDKSAVLRKAVRIRLSDHEPLPDRREGERTYTKVCRAKLWIEPAVEAEAETTPVTITFSANAPPSSSKLHGANPFYLAINLFEASEPSPMPELSGGEKVTFMVLGATRDMKAAVPIQDADTIVTRRTLRALRRYYELTPVPRNVPYPAGGR